MGNECSCTTDENAVVIAHEIPNKRYQLIKKTKQEKLNFFTNSNDLISLLSKVKVKDTVQNLRKLQGYIKGISYRNKLKELKLNMLNENRIFISEYIKTRINKLPLFIREIPKFDEFNWKKYYPNDSNLFDIDFGFTYKTKLLINNDESFYSGSFNLKNEKHGKGKIVSDIFITEGSWFNDKLHGWCRKVYADGTSVEGNLYFDIIRLL